MQSRRRTSCSSSIGLRALTVSGAWSASHPKSTTPGPLAPLTRASASAAANPHRVVSGRPRARARASPCSSSFEAM